MRRFLVTVAGDAEGDVAAGLARLVPSVISVEEYGSDEAVIQPGSSRMAPATQVPYAVTVERVVTTTTTT